MLLWEYSSGEKPFAFRFNAVGVLSEGALHLILFPVLQKIVQNMGNSESRAGRGKSKSLGPSIAELQRAVSVQHMASLLEMIKEINKAQSVDAGVHKAIGKWGGVK